MTQHTIEGVASQVESLRQDWTEKTHDEQKISSVMGRIIDRYSLRVICRNEPLTRE